MKSILATLAVGAALAASPVFAKTFAEMFPQYVEQFSAEDIKDLDRLDFKQGEVTVGGTISPIASFNIPDGYYFLDAKDSEIVLSEFWGNPKGEPLGMIFPYDITPFHSDGWGLEITFDDIGYVSDKDAGDYDYDKLLEIMKQDTIEESKWRKENNFEGLELIGWAADPYYDQDARHLYWAKELKFETNDNNTLNYNLRALGRKGVLVMNFISSMEALDEVSAATPEVLQMVTFTPGNAYADFDPSIDKVAAVGIGGLIAGKVLAKTGFMATALLLLKKFWFVLLIPLFALKGRLFGRKDNQ